MPTTREKPSDDAIVLAALIGGDPGPDGAWHRANELRAQLHKFGFVVSTHQVAAWLGRLTREDSPMFERRNPWEGEFAHAYTHVKDGGQSEYRVTRFGRTQIANRFPGLRMCP